jgi:type VI protein secretion system component VasK
MACGPSVTEKNIQGSQQKFMQDLMANYNTNFAEQQQVLQHLNSVLSPIVQAGPNQTGFSPQERAALNTKAIDTTAAGAAQAERAVANETAGRSDSGNAGVAGNTAALEANVGSAAEGQLSNEELGITEADYATGRANFSNAVGAEEGVSGQFNPVATASAANTAGQTAFGEANTIQQQNSQEAADIAGGVTSLATGAIGGFENLDTTGGSSGTEQLQNFFGGF